MKWRKGEPSPNPHGRPKRGTGLTDILREVAEENTDGVVNKNALAKRIWTEALKGEQWACTLIFNRVEGLPVARTEIETDVEIRVLYVKADRTSVTRVAPIAAADISGSAPLQLPSGRETIRQINPIEAPPVS
jgi:hypothetical protein